MSDLVERLREYASDDHERGCQGRYYDCTCEYDGKRDPLLEEAADRIEQLEAALREIGSPPDHFTINDAVAKARAVLKERT